MTTMTNEFDHPAEFARGGAHAPILVRNTSGEGMPTMLGCACGHRPKKPPQTGRTTDAAYRAHVRKISGYRMRNFSHAVYEPGTAAAGMTWNEWYDAAGRQNPDAHPFDPAQEGPTA